MQLTILLYVYFVQYSFLKNSFLLRLPVGLLKNYEPWAEEMQGNCVYEKALEAHQGEKS